MRIAVYGASGFTGRFTVAELVSRGIDPVLVGRDAARLAAVRDGSGGEVRVAGIEDDRALTDAFADCDAVINCAGPFGALGAPVVRAALAARCHYVDTTGEQRYLRSVFEEFDTAAVTAGVTVVPGMADDGGPGDLIARLAARRLDRVDEVVVADLRPPRAASRGTARTMASARADAPLEYLAGEWITDSGDAGAVRPPGEPEPVPMRPFGLPGVVTVPRHVPARRVRGMVRAELAALLSALTPEVAETLPEDVPESERLASRWTMLAELTGIDGRRARGWVTGVDGYRLTGVIATEGAARLARGTADSGVRTPAQVFDPEDFLDSLRSEGVTWRVEQDVHPPA